MDSFWVLQSESVRLLIRWDALLVLDLGLDVADGVGSLDVFKKHLKAKTRCY